MAFLRAASLALVVSLFGFFFSANSAFANDIWELHTELVRLELESDEKLKPIVRELTEGDGYTDVSFSIAQNERFALDRARYELSHAFVNADPIDQEQFIAMLATRPWSEILLYDFPPFRRMIPVIEQIRTAQKESIRQKYGLDIIGRSGDKTIQTGEIEVSHSRQVEINGSSFPDNHFSLTFDDGPNFKTTKAVLKTLDDWGIKANFFVLGEKAESYRHTPDNVIRKMHESDHGVDSHSWSHPQFTKLTDDEARTEVNDTGDIIEFLLSSFAYRTHMFRFPYGARNSHLKTLVNGLSYTSIMWNIDTLDWKYKNPDTIVELTKKQIERRGKGIILMHDIHTQTTLALPPIIQILADENATVVRLKSVD